jgi:hypothetical protein
LDIAVLIDILIGELLFDAKGAVQDQALIANGAGGFRGV